MVGDPLFGSALLCTQSDRDLVALDPVQYARSGAFSINLWFKPENMSGEAACPSAAGCRQVALAVQEEAAPQQPRRLPWLDTDSLATGSLPPSPALALQAAR